jgi:hypothetical protein
MEYEGIEQGEERVGTLRMEHARTEQGKGRRGEKGA